MIIIQLDENQLQELIRQAITRALKESSKVPSITEDFEKDIMTVKQTADYLDLAVPTIYDLVSKGKIPHSKRGKRLYFSKKRISDWINEGTRMTKHEIDHKALEYTSKKRKVR